MCPVTSLSDEVQSTLNSPIHIEQENLVNAIFIYPVLLRSHHIENRNLTIFTTMALQALYGPAALVSLLRCMILKKQRLNCKNFSTQM